jgi:hypothetical protein
MSEQINDEMQSVAGALAKQQGTTTIGNAIAGMKRQLAGVSKNELIRQWIGLYAKTIQLQKQIDVLKAERVEANKLLDDANSSNSKNQLIETDSSESERTKNV